MRLLDALSPLFLLLFFCSFFFVFLSSFSVCFCSFSVCCLRFFFSALFAHCVCVLEMKAKLGYAGFLFFSPVSVSFLLSNRPLLSLLVFFLFTLFSFLVFLFFSPLFVLSVLCFPPSSLFFHPFSAFLSPGLPFRPPYSVAFLWLL